MKKKGENQTSVASCAGLLCRTGQTKNPTTGSAIWNTWNKWNAKRLGSSGAALEELQQGGLLWDARKIGGRSRAKTREKQRKRKRRIRGWAREAPWAGEELQEQNGEGGREQRIWLNKISSQEKSRLVEGKGQPAWVGSHELCWQPAAGGCLFSKSGSN